jgi:hypothetical protein
MRARCFCSLVTQCDEEILFYQEWDFRYTRIARAERASDCFVNRGFRVGSPLSACALVLRPHPNNLKQPGRILTKHLS